MPVNLSELAEVKTLHQATLRQILEMLLRGQMPREIPRRRTEAAVGIDLQGKNQVNNILRWWKKTRNSASGRRESTQMTTFLQIDAY